MTVAVTSRDLHKPDGLLGIAADYASTSVPIAHRGQSVAEVRGELVGRKFRCAEDVAVLDSERLIGLISIERLLAAHPDVGVEDVMDADPPMVAPDTDQERAARKMAERHECSLAVVDGDGGFVGLIPPYRMLRVLLNEHDEDLARIGGYLAGSVLARGAAEEPVKERIWHRLPWLLVGLLGAMGATAIVGGFEQQLKANVLLAFFIPAVVYMADAVGTQTETVIIRALAAGITVRSVLRRELLTGLVMGVVIGVAFLVFALIGWGEADVAAAVALAMFASCSIATLVAMALPALFQRLGQDPAFGSGPLATVIQDLLSIVVYLAIVVVLVA
jgi:magnesium transporter